jgi:hypothetical protein
VKHDFTDEPAAGFYQSGAAHLRLGKGFHHNRLSLIASISAWGAPDRHAPLWDRRRMMATATRLLDTDRVSVQGLLGRTFALPRTQCRCSGTASTERRWVAMLATMRLVSRGERRGWPGRPG